MTTDVKESPSSSSEICYIGKKEVDEAWERIVNLLQSEQFPDLSNLVVALDKLYQALENCDEEQKRGEQDKRERALQNYITSKAKIVMSTDAALVLFRAIEGLVSYLLQIKSPAIKYVVDNNIGGVFERFGTLQLLLTNIAYGAVLVPFDHPVFMNRKQNDYSLAEYLVKDSMEKSSEQIKADKTYQQHVQKEAEIAQQEKAFEQWVHNFISKLINYIMQHPKETICHDRHHVVNRIVNKITEAYLKEPTEPPIERMLKLIQFAQEVNDKTRGEVNKIINAQYHAIPGFSPDKRRKATASNFWYFDRAYNSKQQLKQYRNSTEYKPRQFAKYIKAFTFDEKARQQAITNIPHQEKIAQFAHKPRGLFWQITQWLDGVVKDTERSLNDAFAQVSPTLFRASRPQASGYQSMPTPSSSGLTAAN